MENKIFNDLFVLELANNHGGSVDRGIEIIDTYADIIKKNNVYASIKLQIRDVPTFIHKDFLNSEERYIKKTISTKLSFSSIQKLVERIKYHGLITSATPFDETSIDRCETLGIDILKIASSDIADGYLIGKILSTKKPTIVSTAGATLSQIDDIEELFLTNHIPLAINHCIAHYPTMPEDAQLYKIQILAERYPEHVIGWSSHEMNPFNSLKIAYALGARTFEKHIDILSTDYQITPYCSLPEEIDKWFKEYHEVKKILGDNYWKITDSEKKYLSKLHRGVYAKRDLNKNIIVTKQSFFDDFYLAVPLQEGQFSCNDNIINRVLRSSYKANEPIKG